jgi:hypothetical protein
VAVVAAAVETEAAAVVVAAVAVVAVDTEAAAVVVAAVEAEAAAAAVVVAAAVDTVAAVAVVAAVAAADEVIQMVETVVDTVVSLVARTTNRVRIQARVTKVAKSHNQVAVMAARKAATNAVAAITATEFTLLLEFEPLLD